MNILATIQHTSTWFMIELLQTGYPKPRFSEVYKAENLKDYDLLHTHIGTVSSEDNIDGMDPVKHIMPPLVRLLSSKYNVITPLRDPILALITRQARRPWLKHTHILEAFEFVSHMDSIYFFPVDNGDLMNRPQNVAKLFKHAGMNMTGETDKFVKAWAAPTYNRVNYDVDRAAAFLKQAYADQDWEYMRLVLGEELLYLREHKAQLRTFFKKHGYKDLPWYTAEF